MTFAEQFLNGAQDIVGKIDAHAVELVAAALTAARQRGGRLFRGVYIVTALHYILAKLSLVGKDSGGCSLNTVKIFHRDATSVGFAP